MKITDLYKITINIIINVIIIVKNILIYLYIHNNQKRNTKSIKIKINPEIDKFYMNKNHKYMNNFFSKRNCPRLKNILFLIIILIIKSLFSKNQCRMKSFVIVDILTCIRNINIDDYIIYYNLNEI